MMRDLSFRPRPIDINKAMQIIRKELEYDEVDLPGVISRSLPIMPTGMEAEDEEEAHIQEAIKQSLGGAVPEKISIPTPTIIIVDGYDNDPTVKPFERPSTYILFNDLTHDEWMEKIEYDLEPEDEIFLEQLNLTKKVVSAKKFELIIDRCEKEAFKQSGRIPQVSEIEAILPHIPSNVIQLIYDYWVKKRKNNNDVPLIADLIEPPDPEDPNPFKPFRRRVEDQKPPPFRKGRKNDINSLMKMRQLRQEMEKSRTLLEMINKREKLKRETYEV